MDKKNNSSDNSRTTCSRTSFQNSTTNRFNSAGYQRPNAKDRLPVSDKERAVMKVQFMDLRGETDRDENNFFK